MKNKEDWKKIRICFDVDGVLCDNKDLNVPYCQRKPYPFVSERLHKLRDEGFEIVLQTARYMVKCQGDQQKAIEKGLLELKAWCWEHNIPFDEIYFGKVAVNIFVDDKAVRVDSNFGEHDWINTLEPALILLKEQGKDNYYA